MKQIQNFTTSLISFYITFSLNLVQEQVTFKDLKPKYQCQHYKKHQTALLLWGCAVLNATQISLVYTLQKFLMIMTIGIVKYSSQKDDRLSRQNSPEFPSDLPPFRLHLFLLWEICSAVFWTMSCRSYPKQGLIIRRKWN